MEWVASCVHCIFKCLVFIGPRLFNILYQSLGVPFDILFLLAFLLNFFVNLTLYIFSFSHVLENVECGETVTSFMFHLCG